MERTARGRNASLWAIGRLQTDADRARVVGGLRLAAGAGGGGGADAERDYDALLRQLPPRRFLVRDSARGGGGGAGPAVAEEVEPRWAMTVMRGPMTRAEIQRAVRGRSRNGAAGDLGAELASPRAAEGALPSRRS